MTSRQASRSLPVQTASISRNLTSSGITHASSSAISMVKIILNGLDSRFARNQPSAPVIATGGGLAVMVAPRTNLIWVTARLPSAIVMPPSPFHQRDVAVVDIHQQRGGET